MSTRNPSQRATSLATLIIIALPPLLTPAVQAAGPIPSPRRPVARPDSSVSSVEPSRATNANPAADPVVAPTPAPPVPSAVTPPAPVIAPAVTPPLTPPSAVTPPASPLAAFNILLVPLDSLPLGASSSAISGAPQPSAAGAGNPSVQIATGTDAAMVVGPAEAASASLRRALLSRGLNDVLTAPLDGSVMRRAVAEGRLSTQVLEQLRDAMNRVTLSTVSATDSTANADTASSGATATPAPTSAVPTTSTPEAPSIMPSITLSAQVTEAAGAIQTAMRWASRLGQSLNYRVVLVLSLAPPDGTGKMRYSMLLVDTLRDSGEVFSFDANGANNSSTTGSSTGMAPGSRLAVYEAGAAVGSTLLQQRLATWTQELAGNRTKLADDALAAARMALAQNRVDEARDALGRVLFLDPARRDAILLMGDLQLQAGDADAALSSYRRALALEGDKGAVWTQIASAYAAARNWPETLKAGQQSLAAGLDSPALRLAMATAQIGRAQLFDAAGRSESVRDALIEAETHLTRARQMAPDDPAVLRLMSQQLTMQNRSREALQMLDRAAPQMNDNRDFQVSYATLLSGRGGREIDAFAAWMRAWKLSGADAGIGAVTGVAPANSSTGTPVLPVVDRARFGRLVEGYDQLAAKMVTRAYALTSGVVDGSVSRDQAASQIKPMTTDIVLANQVLKSFLPPDDRSRDSSMKRLEIGDIFSQALNAYEMYVESGDDNLRDRAIEWHKDAMTRLNNLRTG